MPQHPPTLTPPPAPAGTRPFGWAGFLLDLPESFKLLHVKGEHARGHIRLVDSQQIRLEVAWATVTKKNFNAEVFIRRQLKRSLTSVPNRAQRQRGAELASQAIDPLLPGFVPALTVSDPESGHDRLVGYCPETHRVFEFVYRHGSPAENTLYRDGVLHSFIDQPLDRPMKWAFFGVSFTAPPTFGFGVAKLNLGDMQVQLLVRGTDLTGPGLLIRQIYPAKLALTRMPLEKWIAHWARTLSPTWRIDGCGHSGRKPPIIQSRTIDLDQQGGGPGARIEVLECRGGLRYLFRPFLWRAPKTTRLWMWHDAEADRIMAIQCSHRPEELEGVLVQAARGINWAGGV